MDLVGGGIKAGRPGTDYGWLMFNQLAHISLDISFCVLEC